MQETMPEPISALASAGIAAGTQVLSAGLNNIGNRRANKRMVDFWKMNNQYNHPSSQMARLREAGLNPRLMYGDSASFGNSASMPQPVKPDNIEIENPMAAYQDTRMKNLQADNLRTLNTLQQNQAGLANANTLKTLVESKLKGVDLDIATQTMNDIISKIRNESDSQGYKTSSDFQNMMQTNFTAEENQLIRNANLSAKINGLIKVGQDLKNSEKLEKLRQLEIEFKEANADFTQSNAVINILAKLIGLVK